MIRLLLALLTLPALCAQSSAQTPDEVAGAAFDATLDTPAFAYRFEIRFGTADTTMTERGTATTRADTAAGVTLFRLDLGDETAAFDGGAYRVRSSRTRKVYVDSTLSKIEDGVAGALRFHPTIGTSLADLHNNAAELTDGGRDAVGNAPCRRLTYSRDPLDAGGPFIAVCYDDATRLPSQILIRTAEANTLELLFTDVRAVPVPADSVFSLPATGGYAEIPYDASGTPRLAVGTPAPTFALATSGGAPVRLADYRGRPVLLDFWGSWCSPCVEALPKVQALQEAYPDLVVLGLASYEDADADPEAFARARGATYPVARAPEDVIEAYLVRAFPTYYLVGPDGDIRYSVVHDDDDGSAEADIRAAVGILLGAPR